jgi:hypothetical protein
MDETKIPVTFTQSEAHRGKTYRAGGIFLSLGGGPGIPCIAMMVEPDGTKWCVPDEDAARWLASQGLPIDIADGLVGEAARARDEPS